MGNYKKRFAEFNKAMREFIEEEQKYFQQDFEKCFRKTNVGVLRLFDWARITAWADSSLTSTFDRRIRLFVEKIFQ